MDVNEPLRMFISYSHADKNYLEHFIKHLVSLKRNGIIKEWTDKELIAGDRLDEEIRSNLINSDIVAFLISVDFLNSYYCYEVELKEILERIKSNEPLRIIPIIIRHCDWKDTIIKDFLVIPENGKPVSSWKSVDEAWLHIVNEIKRTTEKIRELKKNKPSRDMNHEPRLIDNFLKDLNDTEMVFQHRNKENIRLEDIYVFPDLKVIKEEYDKVEVYISSAKLTEVNYPGKHTSDIRRRAIRKDISSKDHFFKYFNDKKYPILLNGYNIHELSIEKLITNTIKSQYANIDYVFFLELISLKILVIGDLHLIRINQRFQAKFLESISERFDKILIFSDQIIKYNESEYISFSAYNQFEILPFGHVKRGELINKWNSLGREETISIRDSHIGDDISQKAY